MSDFPLCKRAGFNFRTLAGPEFPLIEAKEVEAFLAKAPVVYTQENGDRLLYWSDTYSARDDIHTARLVMIEPIKQKSREERLEEFIRWYVSFMKFECSAFDLAHFEKMANEALLAEDCICGETNARNCPKCQRNED